METKYISESEYLKFKNQLRTALGATVIGFIIGVVSGIMNEMKFGEIILLGLGMACVPYAWMNLSSFKIIGCLSFVFKLVVALYLGWIITPVALIYNLYQMKRYEKAVEQHLIIEENERAENITRQDNQVKEIVGAIKEIKSPQGEYEEEKDIKNIPGLETDEQLPEI